MPYEKISCRIAIQICVGYFPDGRERHRTISLKHVPPDTSMEAILGIIRALAPVLAYPVTKVTKITKIVLFCAEEERDAGDSVPCAATPAPRVNAEPAPIEPVPETPRIIPFPFFHVAEYPTARKVVGYDIADPSSCASLRQKSFAPGRAPPLLLLPVFITPHERGRNQDKARQRRENSR